VWCLNTKQSFNRLLRVRWNIRDIVINKQCATGCCSIILCTVAFLKRPQLTWFWASGCSLVGVYRRFGGTFCLHPHSSTLNMEAIGSSETLVFTYETRRHHNPEDHHSNHSLINLISLLDKYSFLQQHSQFFIWRHPLFDAI
jgi:hypothetical protein